MTENVSRFIEASLSDADLAQKVKAIGTEAAALVAARLSERSQGTALPFSAGAGSYALREVSIGRFTFHFLSLNPLRHNQRRHARLARARSGTGHAL